MPKYVAPFLLILLGLGCSSAAPMQAGQGRTTVAARTTGQAQGQGAASPIVHSSENSILNEETFSESSEHIPGPVADAKPMEKAAANADVLPVIPPAAPAVVVESERVNAPQSINGALLTCRQLTVAEDKAPYSSVGCRFEANGRAVNMPSKPVYTVANTPVEGVTISMRIANYSSTGYEAHVEIAADTVAKANAASNSLQMNATVGAQAATSGPVQPPRVKNVNSYISNFTKNDFSGEVTLVDSVTSLHWAPDGGFSSDLAGTIAACDNKTFGNKSNWRVPSISELRTLLQSGFKEAAASANFGFMNLNLSASYFSATEVTNALSSEVLQSTLNFDTGSVAAQSKNIIANSYCVAE